MQAAKRRRYSIYGLSVESELGIDGVAAEAGAAPADVVIELGDVPTRLPSPRQREKWIEYCDGCCLFYISGLARFLVDGGRRIRIQVENQALKSSLLQAYLLGTGFAAILHQRGMLPLHVGSLDTPFGTIAIYGESGAGKSTLTCSLARNKEWPIRSDDVAVVEVEHSTTRLTCGPARTRLCADAAKALSVSADDGSFHHGSREKMVVDFNRILPGVDNSDVLKASELKILVTLDFHDKDEPEFKVLSGLAKFDVVRAAIYRPFLGEWFQEPAKLFSSLVKVSRDVTVVRFSRGRCLRRLEANSIALVEFLESLG